MKADLIHVVLDVLLDMVCYSGQQLAVGVRRHCSRAGTDKAALCGIYGGAALI